MIPPELTRPILLVAAFRGEALDSVQAFLLLLLLKVDSADAGCVPGELINGDKHVCGIAVAALLSMNLVEVCGRCRSSSELANGRKVNLLKINPSRRSTVKTWLAQRGYVCETAQTELALTA